MATYYVRTDGSDSNAGTGPATNQAWQTITKAIGATGIAPGDTLYIAPGVYRGNFTAAYTNPVNEGQRVYILGNPTASQFSGVNAGPVIITNYLSNTSTISGEVFTCNKDFTSIKDCSFCQLQPGAPPFTGALEAQCSSFVVDRCLFWQPSSNLIKTLCTLIVSPGGIGPTILRSVFINGPLSLNSASHSGTWDSQTRIQDCVFLNNNSNTANTNDGISLNSFTSGQFGGVQITNCTIYAANGIHVITNALSSAFPSYIQNCYIEANLIGIKSDPTSTTTLIQMYNIINAPTFVQNVSNSGTTVTNALNPINAGISKIQGWGDYPFVSPLSTIQSAINAGINTYSPAADMFGTTWLAPSTPTIGASEFQSYTPTGSYLPTERNASTITIAPGSTSQSIELYLGATGLTASTSGLSAYYNRTRSADVQIPLVARTIGQAWTSGGFAEVNASTMPGVYRLDLPDAAVAAGADDVTVVVRGASGTNGAVMTVKLSSGGLTAAQTAQAVLDAVASTHNNIGSIGASIQDKAGYSLSTPQSFSTTGSVGSVTGNVAGNVVGTVGGVAGNVTGNIAGSVATVASPDNIIDGVWDEQRVGHTASGSFGEKLQTNALADEMLARDLGSGLNAGTAEERTVRSALRAIRNKVNVGSSQMVVKKEDDTTDAWTASVTTTAVSSNVSGIDPN